MKDIIIMVEVPVIHFCAIRKSFYPSYSMKCSSIQIGGCRGGSQGDATLLN
jgi:hypothetical protein